MKNAQMTLATISRNEEKKMRERLLASFELSSYLGALRISMEKALAPKKES